MSQRTHRSKAGVCVASALLSVWFAFSAATLAASQPLSLDRCLSLWRNVHSDETQKVAALAAKDPKALAGALTDDTIKAVKSYLSTIENLKFRCRNFMPPPPGAERP